MDSEERGDRLTWGRRLRKLVGWALVGSLPLLLVTAGCRSYPKSPPISLAELELQATQAWMAENPVLAENLYFRLLREQERVLGPVHPKLLPTLGRIAVLLTDRNAVRASELICQRGLAMVKLGIAPNDPFLEQALHDLGSFYRNRGMLAAAERVYRAGMEVELHEQTMSPPYSCGFIWNLAAFHWRKKEFRAAEALLRRAVAVFERQAGLNHRETLRLMARLAQYLDGIGESARAEEILNEALERSKLTYSEWSSECLQMHENFLYHFCDLGQKDRIEERVLQLLAMSDRHWQPLQPQVLRCQAQLARVLMDFGRLAEAERIQARVVEEFSRLTGDAQVGLSMERGQLEVILEKRRGLATGK